MPDIYILQLESGKYYVGKSENVEGRIQDHMAHSGSAWTRKYKPIKVVEIIHDASDFDEDKYTKQYMSKYGVDNVRGGSYVQEELDEIQCEAIYIEIWSANNCCTRCGRKGHFIKDCYASADVFGNTFVDDSEDDEEVVEVYVCGSCNKEFTEESICNAHVERCGKSSKKPQHTPTCYRCGRKGHYSPDCYARTSVNGEYINSDSDYYSD